MTRTEIDIIAERVAITVMENFNVSRWLTIKEACQYGKIKRDTLMKWIDEGYIYGSKRSGKWIVDRQSIDDFYNQERLQIL